MDLAKAVNCVSDMEQPCGLCEQCVRIASKNHSDVRVLGVQNSDNDSRSRTVIGIDDVKEVLHKTNLKPFEGKCTVIVFDGAENLSTEASNALLKTLEEPPPHVKFVFATTEPEKVLATILSRCQRFDLRRIPSALIVKHLTGIAKNEKVKIDEAALHAVARGADGGMRDAESTLDQLISFCGDKISEDDVLSMFGLVAQEQVLGLAESVLNGEQETTLRQFNALASGGKELRRLIGDLLNHFRNLLVFMVSKGEVSLLEITESEKDALGEQSKLTDAGALGRILEVLTDCEMRLRDAASKKILIEVSLLKAIQAAGAMSLDEVCLLYTSPSPRD